MCRRLLLLLVVCLAAGSVGVAGTPLGRSIITLGSEAHCLGFVAVQGGQLVLNREGSRDRSPDKPQADEWHIAGTEIKCAVGRWYLTYDPSDKRGRVFVARKPRDGAWWDIEKLPETGSLDEREYPGLLRPGSGPRKGWYLTVEERREKARDGKEARTMRRFVLARNPARKVQCSRYYFHK